MIGLLLVLVTLGGCGLPGWEGGDSASHAPKASACVCQCGTTSTTERLPRLPSPCPQEKLEK